MNLQLRKPKAIAQHFRVLVLGSLAFSGLTSCAEELDPLAHPNATRGASIALHYEASEADSGTGEVLCGNGTIDSTEQCDPTTPGWSSLCDANCKRTLYEPCEESSSCSGDNALCAAYATGSDTQFCAPFCQTDTACPVVPGFQAACNFVWCALLCNDFGQCPNGMACVREATFLDAQGNERGTRDVCAPVASTPLDPSQQ